MGHKQGKAIERGNLVHLLLSKIVTRDDVDFAIEDLLASGDITTSDEKALKTIVMQVIKHPKISLYFNNEHKVYNERDIVTPTGELLRPDRININQKSEAIIIDYKTGEKKTSYNSQLNSYASVLNIMGYTITNKFLVYINESVEVVEV